MHSFAKQFDYQLARYAQNTPASWQQFAELSNSAAKVHLMLKTLCQCEPSPYKWQSRNASITITRDWKLTGCCYPHLSAAPSRTTSKRERLQFDQGEVGRHAFLSPPSGLGTPSPTAASTEQTFKDGRVNIACNGGQDRVLWHWQLYYVLGFRTTWF